MNKKTISWIFFVAAIIGFIFKEPITNKLACSANYPEHWQLWVDIVIALIPIVCSTIIGGPIYFLWSLVIMVVSYFIGVVIYDIFYLSKADDLISTLAVIVNYFFNAVLFRIKTD